MPVEVIIFFTFAGVLTAGALVAAALGRRRLAHATLGAVAGAVISIAAVRVCTFQCF